LIKHMRESFKVQLTQWNSKQFPQCLYKKNS
jgi:hypothetical protein